jgi:hypothetical protein
MNKQSLFIILLFTITNCFAQYHKSYNWNESPVIHELTEEEKKKASVGILKKHIVEYAESLFGNQLKIYETEHRITHVNNDQGIARHNTVYIPMYEVIRVLDIKARTINSKGKVVVLNKDNIKEVENVEEYGDFKIFAIEGVEKNSEIEILYTVEKEYDMHGQQQVQDEYPIRTAEFVFITGEATSRIKAYHTENPFESQVINNKLSKKLVLENIPAMLDEEYATPNANKISVAYQCFPKEQNITQGMFWDNVVNNIGPQFFHKDTLAIIKTDIKNIIPEKSNLSTFEKATLIDDYIKHNVTYL